MFAVTASKIFRTTNLLVVISLFLSVPAGADSTRPRTVTDSASAGNHINESLQPVFYKADDLESRAFAAINKLRATYGLSPLSPALDLSDVAREHSNDMVERDYFAHQSPEGRDLRHRFARHGITNWRYIAENIAYNRGYEDPVAAAVEGWMNSPGHRRNILNKGLRESGIGVAIDDSGRVYFTQVFATRS